MAGTEENTVTGVNSWLLERQAGRLAYSTNMADILFWTQGLHDLRNTASTTGLCGRVGT